MNPIELSRKVEHQYREYLKTTFYFRDIELRGSFHNALASGRLSKGPYLEATPVFKRVETPASLFPALAGSPLDTAFLDAIDGDRRLYQHQEQAIRKVSQGRNVLVATGTGSGKTEAFLYPILLHLYQEFQNGRLGPGVRALVLYPMNALANDQRERLGKMGKALADLNSPFRFTFGQYIGETPEDKSDSKRHAQDFIRERLSGELVLRSEMRETPPHILLTNYSMLEFLLLRPEDSKLFDNGRAQWWTFFVLDEAHQYRGSRGIEMALLLRRLRRRLREGGRTGFLRCIATSATLASEGERAVAARFASDLFGEDFAEDDVIFGETVPIPEPGPWNLDLDDYRVLQRLFASGGDSHPPGLESIARRLSASLPLPPELPRAIGALFNRDARAMDLKRRIVDKPEEVKGLAVDFFPHLPEAERISELSRLVELLSLAQDPDSPPDSGAPLLSTRYHLFLKSLEGAFVVYRPSKRVLLERGAHEGDAKSFEIALCRECGQHYFVGKVRAGKLGEPVRDPALDDFGVEFFRPVDDATTEDDRAVWKLCLRCAAIARSNPGCAHGDSILVVKEENPSNEDRADQISECGACGYRAAGRDPVRELVHGADGPNAVIATTLHKELPADRRKVLAFADGRQEAAYFAWYLDNSFSDVQRRNALLRTARGLGAVGREGLSLGDLVPSLRDALRVGKPAAGELQLRREAWIWLYRELLTQEERISLEGVGLAHWIPKLPPWLNAPDTFLRAPWSLNGRQAIDLLTLLLDSLRKDRAIELRTERGISVSWPDLEVVAPQLCIRIGDPKGQKYVRSWEGERGRRAGFLKKLALRLHADWTEQEAIKQAVQALTEVWEFMRSREEAAPSSEDRLLLSLPDARRLNPDWWRFQLIPESGYVYQCDTCARLHAFSIRGVCPRHGCNGTLTVLAREELEPNHYRSLYEEDLPASLRVEEHTAQLEKEKAREFQRDFRQNKIDVLSCSTTFELGVDLGDLDTIFLRNVPPEPFNYAQRVGRAGRRRRPGFAITYCRRGPHDLYHFSNPLRILKGSARAPVLKIANEKIVIRHMTAVALSSFFRKRPDRFKSVHALFGDLTCPSAVDDIQEFLRANREALEQSLRAIVPEEMTTPVGLHNGGWILEVVGPESRFSLAQAEVSTDFRTVKALEDRAAEERKPGDLRWAQDRANTIATEDVLSFLSRKTVIPKYGFPVDVVELDAQWKTRKSEEVSLQRDLSIAVAEFAPTSKLIANKKVWSSYGLKKVPEHEWPKKHYKRCTRHSVFLEWNEGEPEKPSPCECRLGSYQYVVPTFGFVMDREGPREPAGRPQRVFTTRPYFARSLRENVETVSLPQESPVVSLWKASPGLMVVLCEGRRGQGFFLCGSCGAAFRKREKPPHKTSLGRLCSGALSQVSLGHEFETDVLQLQFLREPEDVADPVWFTHSLAYALVEGAAAVLEVPAADLNAVVSHTQSLSLPPIVLYDNVPGGAGLVARLQDEAPLRDCLRAAQRRADGTCGCGEDTSCYGCLRNYRNQFAHQHLKRGEVFRYLTQLRF